MPCGNLDLASQVLTFLAGLGVSEICLCPGRRNAPLVALLEKVKGLRVMPFFEERSAGFFALGRIERARRPVVVCTTSGTACAELLPAVIEAHYRGLPFIVLSADRPPRFRGTGAPQVIDQVGIFGSYVTHCLDLVTPADLPRSAFSLGAGLSGPLHLNVCFDEPVLEGDVPSVVVDPADPVKPTAALVGIADVHSKLDEFLAAAQLPLFVVGELSMEDAPKVAAMLHRIGAPVFAEALSNLRTEPTVREICFTAGNSFVVSLLERGHVDAVVRLGGIPSSRLWRDLDEKLKHVPVLSLSRNGFVGLSRSSCIQCDIGEVAASYAPTRNFLNAGGHRALRAADRDSRCRIEAGLRELPCSEPGMVRALLDAIPEGASVYLGNSLPIREWDLVMGGSAKRFAFAANRGANGIDGQASTFLGWCSNTGENWALLGDLTALYDLAAPWAFRCISPEAVVRIVVLNNGGGQIFSRMFSSQLFLNQHEMSFESWARQWDLEYCRWEGRSRPLPRTSRSILELRPDSSETNQFWAAVTQRSS